MAGGGHNPRPKPIKGRKSKQPKTVKRNLPNGTVTAAKKMPSLYAPYFTEAERVGYMDMKLGSIDDELRMAKTFLARAVKMHSECEAHRRKNPHDATGPGYVLSEVRDVVGGENAGTTTIYKLKDLETEVVRLTSLVSSLEKTRMDLLNMSNQDAEGIAETLLKTIRQIKANERADSDSTVASA